MRNKGITTINKGIKDCLAVSPQMTETVPHVRILVYYFFEQEVDKNQCFHEVYQGEKFKLGQYKRQYSFAINFQTPMANTMKFLLVINQ